MNRRLSRALLWSPALLTILVACTSQSADESTAEESADLSIIGRDPPPVSTIVKPPPPPPPPVNHTFFFRSLGTRCWDFGGQASWAPGVGAMLYTCNGSVAQQIEVHELTAHHDVELRIHGTSYCLGVRGGHVAVNQALEIQATCNGSMAQRFALDGDSILMGTQTSGDVTREYVIEPATDFTANRTPLVVGARDVTDSEYFRLQSIDGSATPPTTGWLHITVSSPPDIPDAQLVRAMWNGWGTVIDIDQSQPFPVLQTRSIPAGVTIRGIRKHMNGGPTVKFLGSSGPVFYVESDNVRITGLRMIGNGAADNVGAIEVHTASSPRVLLDHLEITGWPGDAVNVVGPDGPANQYDYSSPQGFCDPAGTPLRPYPMPTTARVVDAFVHDNGGYGIVTGNGAFTYAQGNVLYHNRHSIASDPWRYSGYAAFDNFVLDHPVGGTPETSNQDFDAHGSGQRGTREQNDPHWQDGIAGDYFDIGWNTFLQHDHYNFNLRGTPCRFAAFHENVTYRSNPVLDQSVASTHKYDPWGNVVNQNSASDFASGDFDGDGVADTFVGTGVTWWFSSGGQSEWRLLNRMPEHATQVRFQDIDGDGRTDVIAVHGSKIDISWAAQSPWQTLNPTTSSLSALDLSTLKVQ